jgi:hypothetical protein
LAVPGSRKLQSCRQPKPQNGAFETFCCNSTERIQSRKTEHRKQSRHVTVRIDDSSNRSWMTSDISLIREEQHIQSKEQGNNPEYKSRTTLRNLRTKGSKSWMNRS